MSKRTRFISKLLSLSPEYKKKIYIASLYSVLNKIFDLAPPLLVGFAVDIVVSKEQSFLAKLGLLSFNSQLIALGIATFVIWALESLFEYLYQIYWRNLAQQIQHDLRLKAFDKMLHLDQVFFENSSTGELLSILNDDVNQLERFLDGGANEILQVLTTAICVGGIFIYLAPTIAFFSVLPIPVILWGSFWFQKKLAPRYSEVRRMAGEVNSDMNNVIGGTAIVKSYTAESEEVHKLDQSSRRYQGANRLAISLSSAFSPLIRMVIVLGFTVTLIMGGIYVAEGMLNVGSYSSLVFLIQRLLWPLTRLGQTFDLYQRARASIQRIFNLIEQPILIRDTKKEVPTEIFNCDLHFEDIRFAYPGMSQVVSDHLDFIIPANKTVGIVGLTGSGKTTLIKLLLRFYEPQCGRVILGSTNIQEICLHQLRKHIALVSQDVYLFHGSIRENIAYGLRDYSEESFLKACKMAALEGFVAGLVDGYETIVGERGQKLSGGQRQRVSLARALLKDAPILLLDEATSAIDNETELAIQQSLQQMQNDRTIVLIAHRLSTVRHADKIIVLDQGRVVEEGSHNHLVENQGVYSRLWKIQTGEAVIER